MSRQAKRMWSARLPESLIDEIKAAADEDGISEADLVQPILEAAMDERRAEDARGV